MNPFSFSRIPPGVRWLLGITAAFFVAQQISGGFLEETLGLIPAKVLSLELWRLFTYQFLHGSFFHILFNLFALWMFGKEIEWSWGTKEFLKFYFTCILGAAVVNTIFEPSAMTPVIGASGGIYGLLVAVALLYPSAVIYLYGIIPLQAKHFVILIGIFEFFASFHGTGSTIARFAHLGGMLTGFVYLKSYEFRSRWNLVLHRFLDFFVAKPPPILKPKKAEKVKKEDLAREVDRILEKVLSQGADSLTDQEREIMRRYSAMKH